MFINPGIILGITGQGSIVAILDDGLDYESHDLQDNFASILLLFFSSIHPNLALVC